MIRPKSLLHLDPHGYALNDFREVARRVVRRQESELGTRRGAHALDAAGRLGPAVCVHFDLHRLADMKISELRLFEVRRHEHAGVGNEREQRLTDLDELTRLDLLARHNAW